MATTWRVTAFGCDLSGPGETLVFLHDCATGSQAVDRVKAYLWEEGIGVGHFYAKRDN
jgi:hypothetical protein